MKDDLETLTGSLGRAVDQEDAEAVEQAARRIRETVDEGLEDRKLEAGAPVLETKRQLHHRLEVVETKAEARRFDKAEEDLDDVADLADRLAREVDELAPAPEEPREGRDRLGGLRAVAAREVRQQALGPAGLVWAVVTLAAVSLAAGAGEPLGDRPVATLLLLAPLVGLHAGLDLWGRDRRRRTVHLLAARPLARGEVSTAKAGGALLAVGAVLVLPALVGLTGTRLGAAGALDVAGLVATGAGAWALASAFLGVGAVLEEGLGEPRLAWAAGLASYAVLGPVWLGAFEAGGAVAGVGASATYLVSPVAATQAWLGGSGGGLSPGPVALIVPAAWGLVGLLWTAWRADTRGLR